MFLHFYIYKIFSLFYVEPLHPYIPDFSKCYKSLVYSISAPDFFPDGLHSLVSGFFFYIRSAAKSAVHSTVLLSFVRKRLPDKEYRCYALFPLLLHLPENGDGQPGLFDSHKVQNQTYIFPAFSVPGKFPVSSLKYLCCTYHLAVP